MIRALDRILFFVSDLSKIPSQHLGHVGLFRFNWEERSCEIDNIVRGRDDLLPGVMTPAVRALDHWAFQELGVRTLYLRVLADNERAIRLYERCGYQPIKRIPLIKQVGIDRVDWIEAPETTEPAERYFLQMKLEGPYAS